MMNDETNKDFLGNYISTRLKNEEFPNPDDSLMETRNKRWPTRWENRVQGVPSMEVTSEERRSNYM